MTVLPVPGSSASRKRSTGCASMAPYTASSWWGYGHSAVVTSAALRISAAARVIQYAHNADNARTGSPPPACRIGVRASY